MKPHFHKWSAWSDPVVTYRGDLQQWRSCTVCNKASFSNLKWHYQTPVGEVVKAIKSVFTQGELA